MPAQNRQPRAGTAAPTIVTASCLILIPLIGQAQTENPPSPPAAEPQRIEVIGTSPLPGQGIDRALLPYSTQVIRRDALDQAQAEPLTDYMARRLPGMQVNDIQGSPFQADLTFRGYRASGLLGASQGLSVYLDGVRVNEPFGDVVNWDMVPEFAIDSVALVPGANPAFGLNTLGGALSFTTASGQSAPGARGEIGLGSFGRKQAELGYGYADEEGWHVYLGGSAFEDDGWRDHSAGRVSQVFAKVGHGGESQSWSLSALVGRSRLVGNGLLPAFTIEPGSTGIERIPDLYATRREAVYTYPDITRNELTQVTGSFTRALGADADMSLLAYMRDSSRGTVNGDGAEDDDEAAGSELESAAAAPPRARPLAQSDEPNAVFNNTHTQQRGWGLGASASGRGGAHQWQLGATFDTSRMSFRQTEQPGFFDDSRGVVAGDEAPQESVTVQGDSRVIGVYATDTWALGAATHLTATARYNRARVSNLLSTLDEDAGVLVAKPRETFVYNSLNPALGLTHRFDSGVTLYANLARNTRVPTVIELGCADPLEPCRLPAGLQSDPYLKQVRSTSTEIGMRWKPAPGQSIELTAYRTENRDDILFRSVSAVSQLGYFQNFARTRNQGIDAQWQGRFGPLAVQAAYSHLQATYEASDLLRIGQRNVQVRPGMRQAGLPNNVLKIGADWQVNAAFSVGGDVQVLSRRITQGNEDRLIEDGSDRAVDLSLPGYALVHLRASWKITPAVEGLLRVSNLFDRRYESYGALAATTFDAQGRLTGEEVPALFVAPGTPRSLFAGLRVKF